MKKTVISDVTVGGETREIVKIESGHGAPTYKIRTPSGMYVGKTSNGGYTTSAAAVKRAVAML